MKKRPKLIHCSFDEVYSFEPRVPEHRNALEDDQIKRICVAPTVKDCLRAMPSAGKVIRFMKILGMPAVVHAYYLEADRVEYDVTDYVLDADYTHEMWVLERPKDWKRIDWLIDEIYLSDSKNTDGNDCIHIDNVFPVRTKYTDNLRELVEGCGLDLDDFKEQMPDMTFTRLAANLRDATILDLKERRQKVKAKELYESLQKRVAAYREEKEMAK